MENNLIRRSDALKCFCDWCVVCPQEKRNPGQCDDIMGHVLAYLPAVDAVEVVRCRECKFFDKGENDTEKWEWCNIWERDCESECYCRYGQRRETVTHDKKRSNPHHSQRDG